MFTKGKGDGPTQTTSPQDVVRPAASRTSARVVPSIISSDMSIKGSVVSQGEMTIDGKIEGDVKADSMTIGAEGEIIGEIIAQQVVVRGKVRGSIRARKVDLEAGARVYGDIVHARLAIQNDAIFEGQVKHAEDPMKSSGAAAAAPAASPAPASTASANTTSGSTAPGTPSGTSSTTTPSSTPPTSPFGGGSSVS